MKLWECCFVTEDPEFIGEKFHDSIISKNLCKETETKKWYKHIEWHDKKIY
jgi:hypothetical protein